MQRKVLCAAVLALALGATGCGGGSKPLTKAQFILKAEEVCYSAGLHALHMPYGGIPALIARAEFAEQAKVDGIAKLTPPAEFRNAYDQYKQALEARLTLFKQYQHASAAQLNTPATAAQGTRLQDQEDRTAAALGLDICRELLHHHHTKVRVAQTQ